MEVYSRSHYAISHRKAGWDCFRHVEILAAGAIPLMLDIDKVPRFIMVHYPKLAMRIIRDEMLAAADPPSLQTALAFHRYFMEHLTSIQMARYLLEMSQLSHTKRLLFIDESLPLCPDYLSALTLIGLKQLLGSRCDVLFTVPYIYCDYPSNATYELYGRGFGYTRLLPGNSRSEIELVAQPLAAHRVLKKTDYDALVVGSIARNWTLAHDLLLHFDPNLTIWAHGEDDPPTPKVMKMLHKSGTHLFVREVPN